MDPTIKDKLLPHKIAHVMNLSDKLSNKHICFDLSDTGTGKTFSAIAVAKIMNLSVFIICPKTIISMWHDVVKKFDVSCIGISNYELIIKEKYFKNNNKEKCPYINKTSEQYVYKWNLPKNTMIIFDEVHRCCNTDALCGNILLSLKDIYSQTNPLLLISATICETPHKFKLFSVLLKWCTNQNAVYRWLEESYNPIEAVKMIHARLLPNICRVKIDDIGTFKSNHVSSEYFDLEKSELDKINKLHEEIIDYLDKIDNKSIDYIKGWGKIQQLRQKIELLKVPIFIDLVKQYLDNKFSIVIFVNYTDTINLLMKTLKTNCVVYGEQSITERLKNIKDFIDDKKRVIICNIQSGGEAIELNDKHGKHKRVSLISPTYSAIRLVQACGRISRIDSKTSSYNKIIFANTEIEKNMCNRLKIKCDSYKTIADVDLKY